MKILVTGGAGFIGSNFVHSWLEKYPEDKLTVLDKLTYAGHKESLNDVLSRINFIQGDICESQIVDEAMTNQDLVVHFAAESHVDRSIIGPSVFVNTNVLGTHVLLENALKHKIKHFHHVSTDEVFGHLSLENLDEKFSESTPYNPTSPYSASKASSDFLVRAWYKTYGLPITITNTSNNYGPYADPEKLVPRFVTNLIENKKVPLMGQGENIRDWCFVKDHCDAIDLVVHSALNNSQIIGETFCVGGNSQRTNLELTRELLKLLGKDETFIEYVPHRLGHDARYAIDSTKIKNVLGWEPKHDFTTGLKETVSWYKDHESWWKPLKKDRPNIDPSAQLDKVASINGK